MRHFQSYKAMILGWFLKKIKKNRFFFRGFDIAIHSDTDPSVAYLIWKGRYELPECTFVERYLNEGATVVELGASYGLVSALIQRKIGHTGRHIAVEANTALVPFISQNAGQGVETVVAAIDYSAATEVRFSVSQNSLSGRLSGEGADDNAGWVQSTTLGRLISDRDLSDIILVMDIEGTEYELVKNDRAALLKCSSIIVEIHPSDSGHPVFSEDEFFHLLSELGFVIRDRFSDVVYFIKADK